MADIRSYYDTVQEVLNDSGEIRRLDLERQGQAIMVVTASLLQKGANPAKPRFDYKVLREFRREYGRVSDRTKRSWIRKLYSFVSGSN